MFEWVDEVERIVTPVDARFRGLELATSGASEAAIAEAERKLGVPLPPSYRAFLKRWNGSARDATRHRFLSTDQLVQKAGEALFRRTPRPVPASSLGACDDYYAEKPAHWLFFYAHAHGSDGLCFDTLSEAPEYRVWPYDAGEVRWKDGVFISEPTSMWCTGFEEALSRNIYSLVDGWIDGRVQEQVQSTIAKVSERLGAVTPWDDRDALVPG